MGTVSDALEKSKVKVSDLPEYKGHFLNVEPKPDLIRKDTVPLFHDQNTFPEEYIIKSEIVLLFGNQANLST